jgi:bifunctional DNA-binding transcriptional regulator/antitoxin component of YhaV-PrlF toxin-antitoxin module
LELAGHPLVATTRCAQQSPQGRRKVDRFRPFAMLSSEGTLAFTIMTVTVKNKIGLTVPEAVRRQAGIKIGDRLEFKVSGGIINIIPKLPAADDEYTPTQRKILNARLAEDLADIKAGRTAGPFNSADEMIAHMKSELKKRAAKKLKNSR